MYEAKTIMSLFSVICIHKENLSIFYAKIYYQKHLIHSVFIHLINIII